MSRYNSLNTRQDTIKKHTVCTPGYSVLKGRYCSTSYVKKNGHIYSSLGIYPKVFDKIHWLTLRHSGITFETQIYVFILPTVSDSVILIHLPLAKPSSSIITRLLSSLSSPTKGISSSITVLMTMTLFLISSPYFTELFFLW